MQLRTVREADLAGKRILVRVDYNVSMGKGLKIVDDTRIRHTIATIKFLLGQNCKIVLAAHLGRPKGKPDKKLSLRPVAKHLEELLGQKVGFLEIGERKPDCRICLLENVRFDPGEKKNDPEFSRKLASYGEVFVNDAFGTAHRAHASVVGVAELLPSYAGLSFAREVEVITQAVEKPRKPLVVVVGGAKVSDKIGMLFKLIERAEVILIGGGMANTFLKAEGYELGKSFYEEEAVKVARRLLKSAKKTATQVLLPEDVVVGNLKNGEHGGVVKVSEILSGMQALDIGPRTQVGFGKVIAEAGTVIWNGPMGVFEQPQFAVGTSYIYHCLTENTKACVVVGGGDTIAAIAKKEYLDRVDHISTGGGAMLELIEKGTLPGIEVLRKK